MAYGVPRVGQLGEILFFSLGNGDVGLAGEGCHKSGFGWAGSESLIFCS